MIAAMASAAIERSRPAASTPVAAATLLALAAALGLVGRLGSGWATPLWFDETFSAVIASQHGLPALFAWCRDEVGGPTYYVLLWTWAALVGTQGTALRLLSLLLSIAAPALAWRIGGPDARTRIIWVALLALWIPAFDQASSARCYPLLTLIGVAAAIGYRRLIAAPTIGRALAWTSLSCLGVLTHYHYAILAAVQGLLFLAIRPRAALRCWPALGPLIPLAAWMTVHLPLLASYTAGGAWYSTMRPLQLLILPSAFFGSPLLGLAVPPVALVLLAAGAARPLATPDRVLAASGVIALAVMVAIAWATPSFTWRYLTALAPTLLFGLAALLADARHRLIAPAALALFGTAAALAIAADLSDPGANPRDADTLERPSAWLASAHPRHVGFVWDSPVAARGKPARLGEVAGYFLRNGGASIDTIVLKAAGGADAHRRTLALVRDRRLDALLWQLDGAASPRANAAFVAALARVGWPCRDFGTIVACRPLWGAPPAR